MACEALCPGITRLSGSQGRQNRLTSTATDSDRPSDGSAAELEFVGLCRLEAYEQGEVVGNDRRPDVCFEVIEPTPGAARETKSPFQAGYVGLDAGSEVVQLAVHPAALDHGVDCQGALATESLTHAQLAGEMITHLGAYPSLGIGRLLDSHKHDIGMILAESMEHEAAALPLYKELLSAVEGRSVMPEEYA